MALGHGQQGRHGWHGWHGLTMLLGFSAQVHSAQMHSVQMHSAQMHRGSNWQLGGQLSTFG